MDLNIRLIQKRNELKLNQKEMAARLGVERGVYSYWEAGRKPSWDKIPAVCKVLDISPNQLFADPGGWVGNDMLIRNICVRVNGKSIRRLLISPQQQELYSWLSNELWATPSQTAKKLKLTVQNASNILERLRKKGYVNKVEIKTGIVRTGWAYYTTER
jgi:transcriptional regulator with XRE-family HTH domain